MARKADLTNHLVMKALRWKEGDPTQFEVKDESRKGFYIRISKGGKKHWYYRYTKDKKVRAYSLGAYPEISCAKAFSRYLDAVEEIDRGGDPYLDKKETKERKKWESERKGLTLKVLFYDHYLPRYSKPNLRTWKNDETYFKTKIEPAIGILPADVVEPKDVEKLIMPMERGGQFATARLTLATLRKIYNWAAKSHSAITPGDGPLLDVPNPCRHYVLGEPPAPPDRFFAEEEIRKLWGSLGERNSGKIAKLQLLTGCRVSEIAGMKWSEIDFEAKTWLLPRSRAKNKKLALLVPLTAKMIGLIGAQNDSDFVFPASSKSGHTTGFGVLQLIKRVCENLDIPTAGTHTMRKTFTTQMAKLGVSKEIRDRLTNRMDSSIDFRHYNFHDYFEEKKVALELLDAEIGRIVGL
jgi:integrase